MHNPIAPKPPRLLRLALLAAAIASLVAIAPGAATAASTKVVAKQVRSASLGKTVLANLRGHTLYSLSAETKGRFICTGSCLADWHPLLIPAGTKPKGPVKLGTIRRPEGMTQVTCRGRPLYAFAGDSKPGQANGEGFKDVGTWHAVTLAKTSSPSPEPQPESPYPSPY